MKIHSSQKMQVGYNRIPRYVGAYIDRSPGNKAEYLLQRRENRMNRMMKQGPNFDSFHEQNGTKF